MSVYFIDSSQLLLFMRIELSFTKELGFTEPEADGSIWFRPWAKEKLIRNISKWWQFIKHSPNMKYWYTYSANLRLFVFSCWRFPKLRKYFWRNTIPLPLFKTAVQHYCFVEKFFSQKAISSVTFSTCLNFDIVCRVVSVKKGTNWLEL